MTMLGTSPSVMALLDGLRSATGCRVAALTVLEEVDAIAVHDVILASCDDSAAPLLDTLASRAWTPPDDAASSNRELCFPVLGADGTTIVGSVMLLDPAGPPPTAETMESVRLLATAASTAVLRESALRERRRADSEADPALIETLLAVRRAEDQVGNSLAVVLGWLRVMSDSADSPSGGVHIAIRRLEEAQAVVAELLRTTARTAIDEHARRPVSMTAVLREAGLDPLAPQSGADVHVLANRAHLVTFLTTTSPMLASEAVVTADSWLVPLSRPDQLGSAGLLALHASGGTLTSHLGGQAAAWSRTTGPVTA